MNIEFLVREPLIAVTVLFGALPSTGSGDGHKMLFENVGGSGCSDITADGISITRGRIRESMESILQPVIYGTSPARSARHFALAAKALNRLEERKSEDVKEWARVLARDSVKLSD